MNRRPAMPRWSAIPDQADGQQTQHAHDQHHARGHGLPPTLPSTRLPNEDFGHLSCLFSGRCRWPNWRLDAHGATVTIIISDVKVDRSDPLPLHEQVAAEIRRAIADGEIGPGERMPPAKDLAAILGVNSNTVLRALRLLRDEGLLEFRRGRGVTVAGTPERTAVLVRARELLDFARLHGYRPHELIEIIESLR
jgi:DNA-binding transcriptional regulator YhcF (GntR family)